MRRPKVIRAVLDDLQPRVLHDLRDVPVPVAPPLRRVRGRVRVQDVREPSVRVASAVLEEEQPAAAAAVAAAYTAAFTHPRHLSQRRDRVFVAAQPKRVDDGVERSGLELHPRGVVDLDVQLREARAAAAAWAARRFALRPAHVHHGLGAVRRGELRPRRVVREVSSRSRGDF